MKLKRINESIASEFVKKDEEETEAGVIEPANKEEKVLEPVNDEVHVAAVDGLEQNKEAAKEVVEDSTITKNAEELVKEESKEKHESLNVKSRVELAKLISEAKKNNQTYKISKCLEEGYRYTFEITGTEKLAEDLEEDPATLVVDLSDSGEGDPEIIPEVKPDEEAELTKEEKSPLDIIKDKFDVAVIGGEDGSKIIIAVKGDLEKEESPKLELPVTEEEFVILSPEFAEPVKEFLDANVSVGSNNSMDGNTGVGLEVPVDVQANGNDVTVGGATTSVLEDDLKECSDKKVEEGCKQEEGISSAVHGLVKDIPIVNAILGDDKSEKKEIEAQKELEAEELPAEDEEEVFTAEEEEIPVDDDFFSDDPDPIYDDEIEGEEKVLEVKPEEIKETEVLSKFGDFEPAEDVKEFWELVKESGKLDDLEFFLDEFDIDDNEKLAEFLADESHRDYLLSALGLGADLIPFEDDEPAPVDYDELEDEKGE